jgi:hypothetical protein
MISILLVDEAKIRPHRAEQLEILTSSEMSSEDHPTAAPSIDYLNIRLALLSSCLAGTTGNTVGKSKGRDLSDYLRVHFRVVGKLLAIMPIRCFMGFI